MELLEKFGIDWRTILAQIVNFTVVLLVLWKFAYKPILQALQNRSEKIEKSLNDAKKIEERMEKITVQERQMLKAAEAKAQKILEQAHEQSKEDAAEEMKKTKEEVRAVIDKARRDIQKAKDGLLEEARADMSMLIAHALEKILEQKITSQEDESLIAQALTKVYEQHKQ